MKPFPASHPLSLSLALAFASCHASAADPVTGDRGSVPDPATLDAVEVRSAAPGDLDLERALTPGGVTVIDGASLEDRAVNHLSDALRYVPGLWSMSSSGADAVFLSSRGSNLDATNYDGNGMKLFQDGLPVTTADGNNHNRFLDPAAARQAVVARGANAIGYGAGTLGGAIDFVSPTARNANPDQISLNGGSHGLVNGRLSAGFASARSDAMLALDGKEWDGYRAHAQLERTSLYANAGWELGDGIGLRFYATRVESDEELPGALTRAQFEDDPSQANPSAITGNFQLNVDYDRLAGKAVWQIDPERRLEFGLSWEEQSLYHPIVDKIMVDFDGDGPNPPVEVFSLLKNTDQRTAGAMLRYHHRLGSHDVVVGLNAADTHEQGGLYRNDGGRRNGLSTRVDNRADSVEVFMLDRWKVAPSWTLVYGAQGVLTGRDVRNLTVADGALRNPTADYSAFNPRIGAIYTLGASSEAYASVSRLYEAPTNFELEDDVRGSGATLDPMHGVVYEVGLRGGSAPSNDRSRWHWDVSAYHAGIRDEILSVEDPAAPGTSLSANIDRTTHAGIEALVGASLALDRDGLHRLEPLLSASLNDFHFDDDPRYGNGDLPSAPRHVLRGEVMYRHAGGFSVGPTVDLIGERYADFRNTYRIGGHTLLGLRASWERGAWEMFGEARNLTDRDHIAVLTVLEQAGAGDAILQPGEPRSFYAGVRYRF